MEDFDFEQGRDYYLEDGRIILTERYLTRRKMCCGAGCRHCPFEPMYQKANTKLKEHLNKYRSKETGDGENTQES